MNQDIEALLDKYYEGETSLEEEQQLRNFFQKEGISLHLQGQAAQFRYATNARTQEPSVGVSYRIVNQLHKRTKVRTLTTWVLRVAAGVTLILVGFAGGRGYTLYKSQAIHTQSHEMIAMKKSLDLSQTHTSASERIWAVNQVNNFPEVDAEITQILINTMNFDDNINVRLAACQALRRFENEPLVREGLIQSLKIQTDPNVQLTLIEILVSIKEKRAADAMQRLAQNQEALEIVRQKAEEGVMQLKKKSTS